MAFSLFFNLGLKHCFSVKMLIRFWTKTKSIFQNENLGKKFPSKSTTVNICKLTNIVQENLTSASRQHFKSINNDSHKVNAKFQPDNPQTIFACSIEQSFKHWTMWNCFLYLWKYKTFWFKSNNIISCVWMKLCCEVIKEYLCLYYCCINIFPVF